MDNETEYYLLLADLRGSTKLPPATATAAKTILLREIDRLNAVYASSIASPLELNYGDEFAGLFEKAVPIYPIVQTISEALKPYVGFRFTVVYGRVGYAEGPITQMGGPVFDAASRRLTELKKSRNLADWSLNDPLRSQVLTTVTNAVHTLVQEMTDYRFEVYRLLRDGHTGVEIAAKLEKNEKSVSNAKIAGHAQLVMDLEATLMKVLEEEDRLRL